MNKLCLVVIDQQKGIDSPTLGSRCNPEAEAVMLELMSVFRHSGQVVIHVRHKSTDPNSVFSPDKPGFDFKDQFVPLPGEKIIEKNVPCALTSTNLYQVLKDQGCGLIALVGGCTSNSVESTARTAGNVGFPAMVVRDACFAFAKQDINGIPRTAEMVHAMSLANIAQDYAAVVDSTYLKQVLVSTYT